MPTPPICRGCTWAPPAAAALTQSTAATAICTLRPLISASLTPQAYTPPRGGADPASDAANRQISAAGDANSVMGCSKVLQRALFTIALAVTTVVLSAAPQDRIRATFRSAADIVSMAVIVRDGGGRLVTGLRRPGLRSHRSRHRASDSAGRDRARCRRPPGAAGRQQRQHADRDQAGAHAAGGGLPDQGLRPADVGGGLQLRFGGPPADRIHHRLRTARAAPSPASCRTG